MAESFKSMVAIAMALGVTEGEFERIYYDNLSAIDKERSNIAIVEVIKEFINSSAVLGRSVEGTVENLYRKICANYSGSVSDLPKSAPHFSRKIKRELKAIDAAGFTANIDNSFSDATYLKIIKNK